jgi:arylsulfatase
LNGKAVRRDALFWEHEGNRAVRRGDFKLIAAHDEKWQLYDVVHDRIEADDLADLMPERVNELKALYDQWAARCGVEPWPVRR